MKLKRTHFHDPEPHMARFVTPMISEGEKSKQRDHWHKAHSAWKARQVKPEPPEGWLMLHERAEESIEFEKALQHYEENRRRWDGFEDHTPSDWDDGNEIYCLPGEDGFEIHFQRNGEIHIQSMRQGQDSWMYSSMNLSVSLFEKICEENGIKLSKL